MNSTLFVEAFGHPLHEGMIDEEEEDLYSVFRERAELMGWLSVPGGRPNLWAMEEAELTNGNDALRIGWVQVGLEPTSAPPTVLPALLQCFSDALRRFGATVSGFQVTAGGQDSPSDDCLWFLASVLNWFNLDVKARANAIVAFDQGLLRDHDVSTLAACMEQRNNGGFEFGSVVDVPAESRVQVTTSSFLHPATTQLAQGLRVLLPEWTPSAAGWVLASVIDAARALESNSNSYAVRLSRVSDE